MKRIDETARIAEAFIKAGLIAAIAGALLLPASITASGAERTATEGHAGLPALQLPPIAQDSMPWLVQARPQKTFKIDTLLLPGSKNAFSQATAADTPTWLSSGMSSVASNARTDGRG